MIVRRHPLRGLFGGLLLGLGLALILVLTGSAVLGENTVIVGLVAFGIIGLLFAYAAPARTPRA